MGSATMVILGTAGLSQAERSILETNPSFKAAAPLTVSRSRSISGSPSICAGSSVPDSPTAFAGTNTSGLAASTMETSTWPKPGISNISEAFPVGSSFPVTEPMGSRKLSMMGAAVPGTPAMAKSPSYCTLPFSTWTWASITLSVLVL